MHKTVFLNKNMFQNIDRQPTIVKINNVWAIFENMGHIVQNSIWDIFWKYGIGRIYRTSGNPTDMPG